MKLTCPSCGCYGPADLFLAETGDLEAIKLALSVPAPLAVALVQYLRLFAPPNRTLTSRRITKLLGELLPMIKEAKIERKGRIWPAPAEYWVTAMENVVSRRDVLALPLKSHGYLLEVVAGIGNSAERVSEAKREESRGYAYSHTARINQGAQQLAKAIEGMAQPPPPKSEKTPAPPEIREQIAKFTGKKS